MNHKPNVRQKNNLNKNRIMKTLLNILLVSLVADLLWADAEDMLCDVGK
jgi:Na+-transporting NADH:ubiquinone oxidoreductase subunit NqrC